MPKFKIVWRDGKEDLLEGDNIADAFNRAGYGGGALGAVDYYKQIPDEVDHEALSKKIHDADSEYREKMCHWLHQYVQGNIDRDYLKQKFLETFDEDFDPGWPEEST